MTLDVNYNSNAFSQDFIPQVWTGDFSLQVLRNGRLAPATDSVVYAPGVILAQYSSGTYSGYYVNYKASATAGQGTPVAILIDNNFNLALDVADGAGTGNLLQCSIGGLFNLDPLFATASDQSDVAAAIAAMGGIIYPVDGSGNQLVKLPT